MKGYEFSAWIESSGGPLVIAEKHLAPLWGGIGGHPSDFDIACDTVSYMEVIVANRCTVLVMGDEPLRTLVADSDDHTLIVRWRWAPSELDALNEIQNIRFPQEYEEMLDVSWPSGELTIFDSASQHSEAESIILTVAPGGNRIQTFTYSPNSETCLLIHRISSIRQPHMGNH